MSNDTTVRFKADISQLKSQMQAAERQIKLVNSEFKAATAGMDDWSKSADGLSAKTKQLASVLDGQNKKLELMEKELVATVKAYGENSAAADRVRIKINEQKAAIAKTESQLKTYEQKLSDLSDSMDEAADGSEDFLSATDKLKNAISDQESELAGLKKHYADLVAEGRDLSDEAEDTARQIKELSGELQENKTKLQAAEGAANEFDESLETMDDAANKAADGFSVMKGALANLVADGIRATISAVKDLAKETFTVGSNFESAMSEVAAVSGAGADEMAQLTAKAEEMGAKTKFSATESASAFQFMSMAGWKTEEMLNGIEGIMNLAAASGADLATASDIVTDALTAMGYSAKDAGRLADVMAAASSNANTNVEMMGDTFRYAAPLVGALGFNMEDTAVAIGLMANAGIKADKAGTALRSILSRLSAPPKECAAAMERFGLSLTDSEGNMKDLNTIMIELRGAFSGLSEAEQTQVAKAIAGQEAMSGLLAIVNATDTDFQKLTVAVNDCNGAAESMANTMQDNVGGQLTLLKSKIEGIMIKLFNRASNSMRDGIETFSSALDKVNWDKTGDKIGTLAKKAADLFAYIINNSGRITSILKTIGTVVAGIFISNKILSVTTAVSGLITVLTSAKSATEGLSAVTKLLGVNLSALPIMAVVAALGVMYAYAKKQQKIFDDNIEATYGLSEAQKELANTVNDSAEAIQSANDARKTNGQNIDVEYSRIKNLKDSYNDLIDENGKVKEGYEDLAETLLDELAGALGTTIDNIKENIDQNGKLGASIDELINKKKDEAKLAAFETEYNEALKNELEYFQQLKGAKEGAKEAQDKLNEAQDKYNKAYAEWSNTLNPYKKSALSEEVLTAKAEVEAAQKTFDEMNVTLNTAKANWGSAQSTIESYQDALAASTEGNAEKVNDALLSMQYGLANHTNASREELQKQYLNTKQDLADIEELYKSGNVSDELVADYRRVNQLAGAELDKWVLKNRQAGQDSGKELNTGLKSALPNVTVTSGDLGVGSQLALFEGLGDWRDIADEKTGDYLSAIDGKKAAANKRGATIGQTTADGAKGKAGEFKKAAEESAEGYTETLNSFAGQYSAAGIFAATTTAEGAKSTTDEVKGAAGAFGDEYTATIKADQSKFTTAGIEAGDATAEGAKDERDKFKDAAEASTDEYTGTLDGNSSKFSLAGKELTDRTADGSLNEAGAMQNPAQQAVQEFAGAISDGKDSAYDAGAELAGEAASGADSKSGEAESSGTNFAQGFINGIGSLVSKAYEKAKELAQKAWDGLKDGQQEGSPSKLTTQSGKYFGEGYLNGIKETTKNVVIAAANMGVDAVKSLQNAQQEGSPSKLTYKSGKNFTKGYINGIASLESQLVKTAKRMVKSVTKELLSLNNFNFTDVTGNASASFAKALTQKASYSSGWMQYKNEQMLADFDKTMSQLQAKSDKEVATREKQSAKVQAQLEKANNKKLAAAQKSSETRQKKLQSTIDAIKKISTKERTDEQKKELERAQKELTAEKTWLKKEQTALKNELKKQLAAEEKSTAKATSKIESNYKKQIAKQQSMKDAYQKASSEFMSAFSNAMSDYQTAAQELIDSTMEGISSKYQAQYDNLISKQNNLIEKLKDAGDLFSLSNANLMTVNDIKAQTEQINRYATKLKKVKEKVSGELFDQIASYDMKEGEAFIDRLLGMSKTELDAYNKAYTEKLNAADQLAQDIYKKDFEKVASDYDKEVKNAFNGLDKELETIGKQCMEGFISGLTTDTKYMSNSIKTFINGMIDTFKKQLGIHSPSKVTKKLGAYTAEGFADGIAANTDMVEKAVESMTAEVENSFDWARLSMVSGFTDAIASFENKAKEVLTSSFNEIGNTYSTKFNEIINKQNTFAKKLKSTGDLFSLSNANVMTVNDLNAQIADIEAYAAALGKIKSKVSSELFEQISSYNVKEGKAFIDRLLSMSDAELKAYNNAYDKKLSLSEQLSESLYKSDLDKIAGEYDSAIEKAFKNLPDALTAIGTQTMQGFLNGLGADAKYVNDSVKSIVNSIISTFKNELGIHSPSKVMEQIGEYTGEGFADGLMSMVRAVKEAAQEITDTVTSSLDWQNDISGARGTLKEAAGTTGLNNNAGTFAGTNTQIINFNQTNNSPKALDRLTLYRQTNNMLFSAKVRLSDV